MRDVEEVRSKITQDASKNGQISSVTVTRNRWVIEPTRSKSSIAADLALNIARLRTIQYNFLLEAGWGMRRSLLSTVAHLSPVELSFRLSTKKSNLESRSTPYIEPFVILHGLLGSSRNWGSLSSKLAETYQTPVYAVDLRNHGESPHSPIHDLNAMSADIRHFTESHSLPRVSVIGHSMGAKTAMLFALQHPKLVARLVIVDASPLRQEPKSEIDWIERYMVGLEKVMEAKVTSNQAAEAIMLPFAPNVAIRKFLLTNLKRESDPFPSLHLRPNLPVLKQYLTKAISEFPVAIGDAEYTGPTLLIVGTKSKFVNPATYPTIRKYFPNLTVREIDAGHWVQAEKPNEFLQAVDDWISPK
ncbi:hypothetical protein SmJEL517_g00397 [Synchytrium microbalum]|uniref:AB hydrolase-1 domain-containing protein n=1 Tax=Synchytrium microbalum TaxID=1806994 RepID=A0A507CII2_9FUNG|nr:uncharacterized protein SmJEL517_g00397 [Synchytrium microbalum]TPX38016.1 hypothetical protein SmJEL517_g00397 [Synchytrium microbalum]